MGPNISLGVSLEARKCSDSIRRVFSTRMLFAAIFLVKAGAALAQQPTPMSEEEKRRAFLRAREEIRTVPITPKPNSSPAPKPKPKGAATPATTTPRPATPSSTTPLPTTPVPATPPAATPRPSTPKPELPKATPGRGTSATPKPVKVPQDTKPATTPLRATHANPSTPAIKPATPKPATPAAATPAINAPPLRQVPPPIPAAPVTIEKSGYEEERGSQPAPPAGWFTRWKYLSKSVRQKIDQAPVQKRRWRYIVIHNSGTRQGNAKAFEYYHLRVRKMPNGLAYHFVIGNGKSSGDGEVEIGNRWKNQVNGGHVHSDYLNNIALGICLVGDFNQGKPTARQLEALEELTRYLRLRVGKIDHKFAIVKAHREINPPRWPTDCPGTKFPYRWLHGKFD